MRTFFELLNPLFLIDFYKADHRRQYPDDTMMVYSNFTPRANKYAPMHFDKVVVFGIQAFVKSYLIDLWNRNFFQRPKDQVVAEYKNLMDRCLGPDSIPVDHIEELHDLGYLPVLVKALPEGSMVNIRVPMMSIRNTTPKFYWLTNYLETLISNELWKPMTSATTSFLYRKEFERHAELTGSPVEFIDWQGHDFSFRGMSGVLDACSSGGGHLTSFNGTDTVPAIVWLNQFYPARDGQYVGGSVPATEHSVMCMNTDYVKTEEGMVLTNELESFRRLITEIYPNGVVSIVADTFNFWKVLDEYLPALKEEIEAREGRVVIRPDSGNPIHIICGKPNLHKKADGGYVYSETNDPLNPEWIDTTETEGIGAYEKLWNVFGGTVNDKGYKMLNGKIGLIYGDSITLERQQAILSGLESKEFAASNLVLGIGSYTFQHVTRDVFGFAMKATYGEVLVDGEVEAREIFKDPITDSGLKKSAKGLLQVKDGKLRDQVTWAEEENSDLITIFKDGSLLIDYTIDDIRERLRTTA